MFIECMLYLSTTIDYQTFNLLTHLLRSMTRLTWRSDIMFLTFVCRKYCSFGFSKAKLDKNVQNMKGHHVQVRKGEQAFPRFIK